MCGCVFGVHPLGLLELECHHSFPDRLCPSLMLYYYHYLCTQEERTTCQQQPLITECLGRLIRMCWSISLI